VPPVPSQRPSPGHVPPPVFWAWLWLGVVLISSDWGWVWVWEREVEMGLDEGDMMFSSPERGLGVAGVGVPVRDDGRGK
jgi:hypothetical protein